MCVGGRYRHFSHAISLSKISIVLVCVRCGGIDEAAHSLVRSMALESVLVPVEDSYYAFTDHTLTCDDEHDDCLESIATRSCVNGERNVWNSRPFVVCVSPTDYLQCINIHID